MKNIKKLIAVTLITCSMAMPVQALEVNNQNNVVSSNILDTVKTTSNEIKTTIDEIYTNLKEIITKYTTEYVELKPMSDVDTSKTFKIKFNKDIKSLEKDSIKVVDSTGKEMQIRMAVDITDSKTVLVYPPFGNYAYGTDYVLIVTKDIQTNEVLKKLKLKQEVVMCFTTKEKEKKPENGNVFQQPNIEKYITADRIEVEGENVYHTFLGVEHYLPHSAFNPNLNKQVYNLLKTQLTDNTRENYTFVAYLKGNKTNNFQNRILISLAPSRRETYSLWTFFFEENKLDNKEQSSIFLELYALADNSSENFQYDEYYINKLEECLIAVFGQDGEQIHNYIMSEYTYRLKHTKSPYRHEKKIGNINVIANFNKNHMLTFYFK